MDDVKEFVSEKTSWFENYMKALDRIIIIDNDSAKLQKCQRVLKYL